MDNGKQTARVAAVGDLHFTEAMKGTLQGLFAHIAQAADLLVLCGDLTDHGLPQEARALASELSAAAKIPTLLVLGNHDYESGKPDEVRQILRDAGAIVLDGDAVEIRGVGVAGIKGFAGGFGRGTLSAFGEASIKAFVKEALDEAMKLESALLRLRTPGRLAVLHYAPIRTTVENEPPEIFPFLGCSRLEEPLNRYQVTAAVHGHAHNGKAEGQTSSGVPVFNVALPLMRKLYPDRPPFRIIEIPVTTRFEPPAAPATQEPLASRV